MNWWGAVFMAPILLLALFQPLAILFFAVFTAVCALVLNFALGGKK